MSKLSVAVCDENQSYGESVSTWLFVEQGKAFSGGFFSSIELFKEQYVRQKFQVILLGKSFLQEEWIQAEIEQEKSILWIYLREDGEAEMKEQIKALPILEKYQPVSIIVRNIYRYYEEYRREEIPKIGEATQILGFYSPAQSIWQTPVAMTMAAILAEKEKVLYINVRECSGLEQWLQEEYEEDLLDVMYFCQRTEQKAIELGRFVYSIENVDYIPPVRDGVLLSELTEKDYMELITILERQTSYNIIILDMGNMFPGFFRVWRKCSRIYIPQEENVLARGMGENFTEMIRRQECQELEEKISWLSLPDWSKEVLTPGCLMQQWIWGGLGDYVRELLGEAPGRN